MSPLFLLNASEMRKHWACDKMRSGADLNGDNLWICRAYLQIWSL